MRATATRLAVLEALGEEAHATTDTVTRAVTARLGSVSVQAVYDVLRVLTENGLVHRIEPAGHPARYELRVGDNHHHLVCRTCGSIEDVDCAVGAAPCLTPSLATGPTAGLAAGLTGFRVDEAEVIYWGTCGACSAASGPAQVEPANRSERSVRSAN
ncbi:Fur family transcriptional regulator [Paraoerskovia sediminicola]|uniref:Fur family transcriptional regulator n=1 Tax=Paraoerskovia sediminicola TaxID=1138587 RepID=UPI0025748165|nr:Fur family transcriptional regulator [Paraoerskovia sediminicola]